MKIIVAEPITESDPEIIGIVATTWNCSGVIDMGLLSLGQNEEKKCRQCRCVRAKSIFFRGII